MKRLPFEYRPPCGLTENPDNPTFHPRDQLDQLKHSIRSFGFAAPIIIDANGVVLCGNGRLIAARELGFLRKARQSEAHRQQYEEDSPQAAEGEWVWAVRIHTIVDKLRSRDWPLNCAWTCASWWVAIRPGPERPRAGRRRRSPRRQGSASNTLAGLRMVGAIRPS